jgi:CBS domain-containing protein
MGFRDFRDFHEDFLDRESGFEDTRVRALMTDMVATATPDDTLADAARLMQECDCGALPVVDDEFRPVGMITDRDIALGLARRSKPAARVSVQECMTEDVATCRATDPVEVCLAVMADHQVRRVPVVDDDGVLIGIVSQSDLARHAQAHAGKGERREVTRVISAISEPVDACS